MFTPLIGGRRGVGFDFKRPPAPDARRRGGIEIENKRVTAGQFPHALVDAARRRHVAVSEIFFERERVEGTWAVGVRGESWQLAGPRKCAVFVEPIERLFSKAIPRAEEPPPRAVIDNERPHPV